MAPINPQGFYHVSTPLIATLEINPTDSKHLKCLKHKLWWCRGFGGQQQQQIVQISIILGAKGYVNNNNNNNNNTLDSSFYKI